MHKTINYPGTPLYHIQEFLYCASLHESAQHAIMHGTSIRYKAGPYHFYVHCTAWVAKGISDCHCLCGPWFWLLWWFWEELLLLWLLLPPEGPCCCEGPYRLTWRGPGRGAFLPWWWAWFLGEEGRSLTPGAGWWGACHAGPAARLRPHRHSASGAPERLGVMLSWYCPAR